MLLKINFQFCFVYYELCYIHYEKYEYNITIKGFGPINVLTLLFLKLVLTIFVFLITNSFVFYKTHTLY